MFTLYHHGSPVCAAKVRIYLHEKHIDWEGEYLDILKGDQFEPAYLKLNPKSVVPTIVHDGTIAEQAKEAGNEATAVKDTASELSSKSDELANTVLVFLTSICTNGKEADAVQTDEVEAGDLKAA